MSLDFDTTNPEEAQALIQKLELRQKELETAEKAKENFLDFVKAVWPEFIGGYHHKKIAEKFQLLKDKKLKRLIVNMPPRTGLPLRKESKKPDGSRRLQTSIQRCRTIGGQ